MPHYGGLSFRAIMRRLYEGGEQPSAPKREPTIGAPPARPSHPEARIGAPPARPSHPEARIGGPQPARVKEARIGAAPPGGNPPAARQFLPDSTAMFEPPAPGGLPLLPPPPPRDLGSMDLTPQMTYAAGPTPQAPPLMHRRPQLPAAARANSPLLPPDISVMPLDPALLGGTPEMPGPFQAPALPPLQSTDLGGMMGGPVLGGAGMMPQQVKRNALLRALGAIIGAPGALARGL